MKTKLRVKSCPFCGGEVEATHGLLDVPKWFFLCNNKECGAVMSFSERVTNDTPDKAFELYNKRHYPSEQYRWLHGED